MGSDHLTISTLFYFFLRKTKSIPNVWKARA